MDFILEEIFLNYQKYDYGALQMSTIYWVKFEIRDGGE